MPINPNTAIKQVLNLAGDETVSGRELLATAIAELYGDQGADLNERERGIMHGILYRLIRDAEKSVRAALSDRLAKQQNVPREIISALAKDEIDVARPVLAHSPVLWDKDLIEIIRKRTLEHQLAITARSSLSEGVSDALVETGNAEVMRLLLENQNANISAKTMAHLVAQSERVSDLQQPLVRRTDLTPELATRMCQWISETLRQTLLQSYEIDAAALDEALAGAAADTVGATFSSAETEHATKDLAVELVRSNAIDSKGMVNLLRRGEIALFEAVLAEKAGLDLETVQRFVVEPDSEGLSVLCNAVEINRSDFATIYVLTRRARSIKNFVPPQELSQAVIRYGIMKHDGALKVLEAIKANPDQVIRFKRPRPKGVDGTDT